LWDPNNNNRVAGYVFNELKFSETTKAQIAGRIERVNLSGMTPAFIPDVFDLNVDPTAIGPATPRNLHFTPKGASVGLLQNLPYDLVASVTAQYVERAPKPAELFSRGGHDATATFDIGNPNLGIETAKSIEVGLRRAAGPLRFELTGYYTKFNGFIFCRLNGNTCDGSTACVDPADPAAPLDLKEAIYSQRDATFRGAEFQSQLDVGPLYGGIWGVEDQFDVVRATFIDGTNVAADSAGTGRRRRLLARHQLVRTHQPAACVRAERHRADRRDADARIQFAQGRGQLQDEARSVLVRRPRDDGRPRRQQPVEREHPQLGLLHQGSGPAAGYRRARVRESEVLSRKAERRTTADSPEEVSR
jgi:outer membrane receptor protein involved in Fe transport